MHEISDEGTIKAKLEMLDNLIDYEAASKIILGSIKVGLIIIQSLDR
jgi:hypothetical protein